MATKTVGKFTYNEETRVVTGPKVYMESGRYDQVVHDCVAGLNTVFNYGGGNNDTLSLLLVCIQTDYAAWAGQMEIERMMDRAF